MLQLNNVNIITPTDTSIFPVFCLVVNHSRYKPKKEIQRLKGRGYRKPEIIFLRINIYIKYILSY